MSLSSLEVLYMSLMLLLLNLLMGMGFCVAYVLTNQPIPVEIIGPWI